MNPEHPRLLQLALLLWVPRKPMAGSTSQPLPSRAASRCWAPEEASYYHQQVQPYAPLLFIVLSCISNLRLLGDAQTSSYNKPEHEPARL